MKPVFAAVLLVFLYPGIASAYLDPGNGSYLFQIFLGLFFTAAYSLRSVWVKSIRFIKGLFRNPNKADSDK